MNNVKSGMLKAASILTIILFAVALIASINLMFVPKLVTKESISEILIEADGTNCEETSSGYILTLGDGEDNKIELTFEEMEEVVKYIRMIIYVIAGLICGLSVLSIILAIKILKSLAENKNPKGSTIALMILNLFIGSFVVSMLCLVALCIKDDNKIDMEDPKVKEVMDSLNK